MQLSKSRRKPHLEEVRHWLCFNGSRWDNQPQLWSTTLNLERRKTEFTQIMRLKKFKYNETIFNYQKKNNILFLYIWIAHIFNTFFNSPSKMSVDIDLSWASSTIITLQQVFTKVRVKAVQNRKMNWNISSLSIETTISLLLVAAPKHVKISIRNTIYITI